MNKYTRLNEDAVIQDRPDAHELANEFGTSKETMQRFINRFAPSCVVDNYFHAVADTMLFVHIPKTAGVSVGRSFHEAFDTFRGVEWDNVQQSFRSMTRRAIYMQTHMEK